MATTQQTSISEHGENQGVSGNGRREDSSTGPKSEEVPEAPNKGYQAAGSTFESGVQEESSEGKTSSVRHPTTSSRFEEHLDYTLKQLMDYIAQLERRIEQLEAREYVNRLEREDRDTSGPQSDIIEESDESWKSEEEVQPARSQHDVYQFYLEADEPPYLVWAEDNRWRIHGTFVSEVDANPLIRILYRWNGPKPNKISQAPDPKDIDILELRIASKPITEFLGRRLEFDLSLNNILHISKPFKTLIRSFSSIEEECSRLLNQELVLISSTIQNWLSANEQHSRLDKPDHAPNNEETHRAADTDETPMADSQGLDSKSSTNNNSAHDFQHLVEFAEKYLSASLDLFKAYESGSLTKITFDNLWMLFDTGDTIYCPRKKGRTEIERNPDSLAYTTGAGVRPQAYRVATAMGGLPRSHSVFTKRTQGEATVSPLSNISDKYTPLHVYCFHLDFDVGRLSVVNDVFEFPPFGSKVDIISLEAYPVRYRNSSALGGEDLVAQGLVFLDLMLVCHKRYDGLTVSEERVEQINSDVIVHHGMTPPDDKPRVSFIDVTNQGGFNYTHEGICEIKKRRCSHNNCPPACCISDYHVDYDIQRYTEMVVTLQGKIEEANLEIRSEQDIMRCREFLEKEDLLCLFGRVMDGYSLRSRKWVRLDITLLRPVSYEGRWSELALPSGFKRIIQAIVGNIEAGSQQPGTGEPRPNIDFGPVHHGGQGCVILLQGAPGVGKTSTAESVAAFTRRPLLHITGGDIGFNPQDVERNLENHFALAQRWGCVLLLGEADIFLAKRTRTDIERNALVSIFLKVVDYYPGILILTSNRVGGIDEAFHSRIHLTLYYPTLGRAETLEIFKLNFRRIEKHNEERLQRGEHPVKMQKKLIQKYWKLNYTVLKWNGRQIRNAFQTAMAMAEYEAEVSGHPPIITFKHFESIANASADYMRYITDIQGLKADHIALGDSNRPDGDPRAGGKLKKLRASDFSDSGSSLSESESSSSEDSDDRDAKKKRGTSKK